MTAKFSSPLDNIKIASPCSQDWDAMIGSERKRHCGECKLNVYNLSGMTRTEAESFLIKSENRVCVRFYRRADGSLLTQDCPVGWQAVKKRISKTAAAFVSLIFGLLSGIGFMTYFSQPNESPLMGEISISESNNQIIGKDNSNASVMMGNISFDKNEAVMGKAVGPEQISGGKYQR